MERVDDRPRTSDWRCERQILAGFALVYVVVLLARLLFLAWFPASHGSRVTAGERTPSDLDSILGSLADFANDHGDKFPETLHPLVTPDAEGRCYLEGFNGHVPRDPWKREYVYEPPHTGHPEPRVFSLGKDGQPGGSGEDADVDSDTLRADR